MKQKYNYFKRCVMSVEKKKWVLLYCYFMLIFLFKPDEITWTIFLFNFVNQHATISIFWKYNDSRMFSRTVSYEFVTSNFLSLVCHIFRNVVKKFIEDIRPKLEHHVEQLPLASRINHGAVKYHFDTYYDKQLFTLINVNKR